MIMIALYCGIVGRAGETACGVVVRGGPHGWCRVVLCCTCVALCVLLIIQETYTRVYYFPTLHTSRIYGGSETTPAFFKKLMKRLVSDME